MRRYIYTLLLMALSLSATAQDKLFFHHPDKFGEHKMVELEPFDSVQFTKSNMRFYRKGTKRYTPVQYQNDVYDYYTFENLFPMIYKPNELKSMDFDNPNSQWCWQRSAQSEHFVIFWESGFGNDPKNGPGRLRFDPQALLDMAEYFWKMYTDSLAFAPVATSQTVNKYKLEIYVNDKSDWLATGSGYDDKIGALWCNVSAVTDKVTLAHEIGHSFQYIVSCDLGLDHGWRYGFGSNASGGCAWWESCANWQAYKCYPESQFSSYFYPGYFHLNLLHEEWRYYNIFIQDYWCMLHGMDFIGRLWREETKPEDPVEAYKRITEIDQQTFNDQIYDFAARSASWDIDHIREAGATHMVHSTNLSKLEDGKTWQVDSTSCPQNYGYNVIKLNNAPAGTVVSADFKGIAGAAGYRSVNIDKAGWRYGFVALSSDGTRTYGEMQRDAEGTATFTVPENVETMWFVVSGAPTEHWRHAWDDNVKNDEQWPDQVRFTNTNKYGEFDFPDDFQKSDTTINVTATIDVTNGSSSVTIDRNTGAICNAFGISMSDLSGISNDATAELCTFVAGSDGTEQEGTSGMLYFFDKDGNPISGINYNDADYRLCTAYLNYYEGWMIFTNEQNPVKPGETYTLNLGIRYKPADEEGKTYYVRYVVTVKIV